MKTGIRVAVAMVAAVSSGAMAVPFSVSSEDMHDGQALARKALVCRFRLYRR